MWAVPAPRGVLFGSAPTSAAAAGRVHWRGDTQRTRSDNTPYAQPMSRCQQFSAGAAVGAHQARGRGAGLEPAAVQPPGSCRPARRVSAARRSITILPLRVFNRHQTFKRVDQEARGVVRSFQCLLYDGLRRGAGRGAVQDEGLERRQRAAVERGGKGGAAGVGDLGAAEVEDLELSALPALLSAAAAHLPAAAAPRGQRGPRRRTGCPRD